MEFGTTVLKRGQNGPLVIELQMRLAGFRGTVWDGDYGPGTERQVLAFQKDVMGPTTPTGVFDRKTAEALIAFGEKYKIDFAPLKCPCGVCSGFGKGQFKNECAVGKPVVEAFHRYEYPGIHKAILHAFRATQFYCEKKGIAKPFLTSGYRCWVQNGAKGRESTNHMGKAIDCDFPMMAGDDKRDDMNRCDQVRGFLVETSDFQIGWSGTNRKALEPSSIAPTWIHMDVRSYQKQFLLLHLP